MEGDWDRELGTTSLRIFFENKREFGSVKKMKETRVLFGQKFVIVNNEDNIYIYDMYIYVNHIISYIHIFSYGFQDESRCMLIDETSYKQVF